MTGEEAIAYIEDYSWSSTRFGLERTRELLRRLGNPQKKLKFVHVAGSNGKGSTCAMLDAVLRAAGYRTGLYTSPYIQDFCERIQLDGHNIRPEELAEHCEKVKTAAEAMDDHPSQFELVTALAMDYFADSACEIVVLEVGMGGALDSTNAIDAPEAAVICNIGLEHTEYLGDTLEKIAAVKGGIIKPDCGAVCYDGAPEVTEVIRRICAEQGAELSCVDLKKLRALEYDLHGQRFSYDGREYAIGLLGPHQLYNAATALETVQVLRRRGWNIPEDAVRSGLANARWPARLEVLGSAPLFILDGGHNPQCAEALAESLKTLLPGKKAAFLAGVLADKDYPKILDIILPFAERFCCVTPLSGRALPAEAFAEAIRARGGKAEAYGSIGAGLDAALQAAGEQGIVVAFGSLYMAGEVRTLLLKK